MATSHVRHRSAYRISRNYFRTASEQLQNNFRSTSDQPQINSMMTSSNYKFGGRFIPLLILSISLPSLFLHVAAVQSTVTTTPRILSGSVPSVFSPSQKIQTADTLKTQILQLGASLDRGQAYNPTSGSYYADRMAVARCV